LKKIISGKIFTFIVVTYAMSWLIWAPNLISHNADVTWAQSDWLHLAGGLGPFFGAVFTTIIFDGIRGIKKYFIEKYVKLPGIKWLVIGVGMPASFFLISYLVAGMVTGKWIDFTQVWLSYKIPIKNGFLIWVFWLLLYLRGG